MHLLLTKDVKFLNKFDNKFLTTLSVTSVLQLPFESISTEPVFDSFLLRLSETLNRQNIQAKRSNLPPNLCEYVFIQSTSELNNCKQFQLPHLAPGVQAASRDPYCRFLLNHLLFTVFMIFCPGAAKLVINLFTT